MKKQGMKYPDICLRDIETVWNMHDGVEGIELFKSRKTKVVQRKDCTVGGYVNVPANVDSDKVLHHFKSVKQEGIYFDWCIKKLDECQPGIITENKSGLVNTQKLFCWHEFWGYWDIYEMVAEIEEKGRKMYSSISEIYSTVNQMLSGKIPENIYQESNYFLVRGNNNIPSALIISKHDDGWYVGVDTLQAMSDWCTKYPVYGYVRINIFTPV